MEPMNRDDWPPPAEPDIECGAGYPDKWWDDGGGPWQPAPVFEAVCIVVFVLSAVTLAALGVWYCW